jgi:hypothetical protein
MRARLRRTFTGKPASEQLGQLGYARQFSGSRPAIAEEEWPSPLRQFRIDEWITRGDVHSRSHRGPERPAVSHVHTRPRRLGPEEGWVRE